MKKLTFVFMILFSMMLISGCGDNSTTVRFNQEGGQDTPSAGDPEKTKEVNNENNSQASTPSVTIEKKQEKSLAVTSMEGGFLKTNQSFHVVRGTTPSTTHSIEVNGYKLQQYKPGQKEWSYIASTRFGTLHDGSNNYVVKAFGNDGMEAGSMMFSIDYSAPAIPDSLPHVGSSVWMIMIISTILSGIYILWNRKVFFG